MSQLFRTKSIDALVAAADEPGARLKRTLGLWSLIALGIGSVIGSGIFTLTGTAAAGETFTVKSILKAPVLDLILHGPNAVGTFGRPGAGPGIVVSFLLVALACGLAGLCYAELASMIPIAGSAYTYCYATLGEIFAWIIGWDLILEYAVSNMAVAVGFSAYFNDMLDNLLGFHLPAIISGPTFNDNLDPTGAWFNVPAFLVVMALTWVLVRGIKESSNANNGMVVLKLIVILAFIFGAAHAIKPGNWHPFFPTGSTGVLTGAAVVFFTYIGFDSVSTAAEECNNPQRDLPRGILWTLVICGILYAGVALVLTGIAPYKTLANAAPVANALKALGMDQLRLIVTAGALIGMISSLLVFQYGQARVWFAMSRDRLLPDAFSKVHPKFRTPYVGTWVAAFLVGIPSGLLDIGTLADLTNIGTLFAFMIVAAGVLILRKRQPERTRSFRVPWSPAVPILSMLCCFVLMLSLPLETWIRFFVWLGIGMVIYFFYGKKRADEVAR